MMFIELKCTLWCHEMALIYGLDVLPKFADCDNSVHLIDNRLSVIAASFPLLRHMILQYCVNTELFNVLNHHSSCKVKGSFRQILQKTRICQNLTLLQRLHCKNLKEK